MQIKTNITIRNVNVYYEYYKLTQHLNKPTIILIHGFLSSSFSFRKLIPFLVKSFPVISLDIPPFGKSEKSRSFYYSYYNMAQIVIDLAKKLQLKSVILVGHSMGGQIALNAAHIEPSFIKKVILLCSSGYLERSNPSIILSSYLPFFSVYVKKWLKKKGIKGNLLTVTHDHSLIDDEMIRGYEDPFLNKDIFHGLTKLIRHREGDLPRSVLNQIDIPCLLIWGEEDRVVPLKVGNRLHNDLPHSKMIIYKETGHLLPEEKPQLVAKDIMEFINDL